MKYSKAIASVVGSMMGYLAGIGLMPESYATPELIGLITGILTAFAVYIAPANRA